MNFKIFIYLTKYNDIDKFKLNFFVVLNFFSLLCIKKCKSYDQMELQNYS